MRGGRSVNRWLAAHLNFQGTPAPTISGLQAYG